MAHPDDSSTRQQVRRVLVITLLLNLLVAFSKIIIGTVSGALSITADGFHSLVDGSSNLVALIANRLAARPADEDHPYGHRRYETIAALAIGGFLMVTAWEIVSGALERLGGTGEPPTFTPLTFAVMLGTLAANVFVTTYESRAGKRLRSELLIADAAHTRTDVFVSLSVIASMVVIALLGWYWIDTVAALVIVVLIVRAAWEVVSQTGGVLVDKAPYSGEQLAAWAEEVPSVERVVRARSRGPADAAHIDIDVQVPPQTTADHTAAIADAIRDKLHQEVAGVEEIEVHFVPTEGSENDYALTARARADALGLSTHAVRVGEGETGKVLEMHVEVPSGQTLAQAHDQVSQLEADVRGVLPDVADVITHIEPAPAQMPESPSATQADNLRGRALELLGEHFPEGDWHNLNLLQSGSHFTLTMHVTLPPELPLETAHLIAERADTLLRTNMLELERVTIHTEPPESI